MSVQIVEFIISFSTEVTTKYTKSYSIVNHCYSHNKFKIFDQHSGI